MSIRLQLLVIALTTLLLPWAGCQYARELENTLRLSQESALQSAADTIANALSAQPERVLRDDVDDRPFDASHGDLYVFSLHNEPLLDGYREDWDLSVEPAPLPNPAGPSARVQAGNTERYMFLYLEVIEAVADAKPNNARRQDDTLDRVELTLQRPDGTLVSYFFATGAPGPVEAQISVHRENGGDHAIFEPRIQAFWRTTSRGFSLEVRLPRSLVDRRLWIAVTDAGGGTVGMVAADPAGGGRLYMTTPGLDDWLTTFIRTGTRATVVDTNALKLGVAGSLASNRDDPLQPSTGTWYRRFVASDTTGWPLQVSEPDHMQGTSVAAALAGRPAAQWLRDETTQTAVLSAAAPIRVGGATRGAVVLEQAGDQMLELRDRALAHLFNMTLLGTALAAAIAFGMGARIGLRIERLRLAADTAVTNDGRIRLDMPESRRADEIGALARGFERLLARLNEHTQYLRTLGGKLSHELRTPLTIVRSSLDNLELEGVRTDQVGYVTRAREGAMRLQSILGALGAASRVEASIMQADRINFDLKEVVESAVVGYRAAFPAACIELDAPSGSCFLRGAPDLIVQMMDKLIENAVDFCAPSGTVAVRLLRNAENYVLEVDNDGAAIPPEGLGRLFESLYEHRPGVGDRPHFGLGLYIVRLIAEFHGGRARAANRPGGAVFSVTLPLIRPVC